MKVYRNIYVKYGLPKLIGKELLYFTDRVIFNPDVEQMNINFDRNQDIYLGCDCDAKKYASFVKYKTTNIKNNKIINNERKGTKCSKCY